MNWADNSVAKQLWLFKDLKERDLISDWSGSKFFVPCRVRWAIYGLVLILENFPKNIKFFNFFPFGLKKIPSVQSKNTRVKGGLASYLLRVKSKLGSGQSPSLGLISGPLNFFKIDFKVCLVKLHSLKGWHLVVLYLFSELSLGRSQTWAAGMEFRLVTNWTTLIFLLFLKKLRKLQ